jgi:hypothetical protein
MPCFHRWITGRTRPWFVASSRRVGVCAVSAGEPDLPLRISLPRRPAAPPPQRCCFETTPPSSSAPALSIPRSSPARKDLAPLLLPPCPRRAFAHPPSERPHLRADAQLPSTVHMLPRLSRPLEQAASAPCHSRRRPPAPAPPRQVLALLSSCPLQLALREGRVTPWRLSQPLQGGCTRAGGGPPRNPCASSAGRLGASSASGRQRARGARGGSAAR